MNNRQTLIRKRLCALIIAGLFIVSILFTGATETLAQRGGSRSSGRSASRSTSRSTSSRGSVHQSNTSHSRTSGTTASRTSRTTVSRTGRAARPAQPVARPPAARRPATRPAGGSRSVSVHRSYSYGGSWKSARRDYYRFRTINHLIRVGARLMAPPPQHTVVVVSGTSYYYAGGVYYVQSGTSYVVVASPPGAVVYAVPASATVVYVGTTPYYYYGGTYYVVTDKPAPAPPPPQEVNVNVNVQTESTAPATTGAADTGEAVDAPEVPPMLDDENNYEVVAPPIGATVPYLPQEADEETIDGKKYFIYEGTYYRPYSSEGDTVYMVVEDPKEQ